MAAAAVYAGRIHNSVFVEFDAQHDRAFLTDAA